MFDWEEYLKLAHELASTPGAPAACCEAKLRASVSRAYYSVLIRARNHLRDIHGLSFNDKKLHTEVIGKFCNPPKNAPTPTQKTYNELGVNLGRLSDNRGKADYHDFIRDPQKLNEASLRFAIKIAGLLDIVQTMKVSDLPGYT